MEEDRNSLLHTELTFVGPGDAVIQTLFQL